MHNEFKRETTSLEEHALEFADIILKRNPNFLEKVKIGDCSPTSHLPLTQTPL